MPTEQQLQVSGLDLIFPITDMQDKLLCSPHFIEAFIKYQSERSLMM